MVDFLEIKQHSELTADILSEYKRRRALLGYNYIADLNDQQTSLAEAIAYRMLLQNAYYNQAFEELFLLESYSSARLDKVIQSIYGISRLTGAYPSAEISINFSSSLPNPLTIPAGWQLRTENGEIAELTSRLSAAVGASSITGNFKLLQLVESSSLRPSIIVNPLAYVESVTQSADFSGGRAGESDADYITRARLSRTIKSTAGTAESYIYYAKSADARVKDVQLKSDSTNPYQITIYFYAPEAYQTDGTTNNSVVGTIKTNLETSLNSTSLKPLSDSLTITAASLQMVNITASITIPAEVDLANYNSASKIAEFTTKLNAICKLGGGLKLFQIKNILACETQVLDVTLTSPTEDLAPADGQIYKINNLSITTSNA